jgi:hypothetical protein
LANVAFVFVRENTFAPRIGRKPGLARPIPAFQERFMWL